MTTTHKSFHFGNTLNRTNLARQPCKLDCPGRAPGCAASCPKWAEYLELREKDYQRRADLKRVNDAVHEGYQRLSRQGPRR